MKENMDKKQKINDINLEFVQLIKLQSHTWWCNYSSSNQFPHQEQLSTNIIKSQAQELSPPISSFISSVSLSKITSVPYPTTIPENAFLILKTKLTCNEGEGKV
jgi:hypothetical protein